MKKQISSSKSFNVGVIFVLNTFFFFSFINYSHGVMLEFYTA